MRTQTKNVEVFEVEGREFFEKEEALLFEKQVKEWLGYTFHSVRFAPDLTEGRGYYKAMIVAVKKSCLSNTLLHYLVTSLGSPIKMVMGVSPIDNWIIEESKNFSTLQDLTGFLQTPVMVGIGDYRKQEIRPLFVLDENGKALETHLLHLLN